MCTEAQFAEPAYAYWCEVIREVPRLHRKQWEFCYVLQALAVKGRLAPGMTGLGFGVGGEPLAAVLADRGVAVLATDLGVEAASAQGWVESAQHARELEDLNQRGVCPPDRFANLVRFREVDMNALPDDLGTYDLVWSACALEHLGSIKLGGEFILNSLELLQPGGVAVHTTEYNLEDGPNTMDESATVLFRRQDLQPIIAEAARRGFRATVNWNRGTGELDAYADVAPYSADRHLKVAFEDFVTTSIGLIFERPEHS
jgi:cyclopropane fatty-acyl-phospholipid synthase-like methyltransferase